MKQRLIEAGLELIRHDEQAVLRLTLEMSRQVEVRDDSFEAISSVLPDRRQQLDLVALISTYNMVSRFLVALKIMPENRTD